MTTIKKNGYPFDGSDDDSSYSSSSIDEMSDPSVAPSEKSLSASSAFPYVANNIEVMQAEKRDQK